MTPSASEDVDPVVLGQALMLAGACGPDQVVTALRQALLTTSLAVDLVLYLVDYRLTALVPVEPRAQELVLPEPLEGPVVGRAHREQRPVLAPVHGGHLLCVPVAVRGQRLGVLAVTLSRPPAAHEERAARSVALAAAYLLLEAGTGSDLFEVGRRRGRLSLAAEMQWQLLPARGFCTPDFHVAGHLEPALRVAGDAFDFTVDDGSLTLAVVDASASGARGSEAALLSTLAVTALRNARRAGLPLEEQAALASDLLYAHAGGAQQAAVLLLRVDTADGTARAVDAGSGVLVRAREGIVRAVDLTRQPPLGAVDDTRYAAQEVDLVAGDRTYAVAGPFDAIVQAIELLGPQEGGGQDLAPSEAVRRLVAGLLDGREREDDTTVVCLDWHTA